MNDRLEEYRRANGQFGNAPVRGPAQAIAAPAAAPANTAAQSAAASRVLGAMTEDHWATARSWADAQELMRQYIASTHHDTVSPVHGAPLDDESAHVHQQLTDLNAAGWTTTGSQPTLIGRSWARVFRGLLQLSFYDLTPNFRQQGFVELLLTREQYHQLVRTVADNPDYQYMAVHVAEIPADPDTHVLPKLGEPENTQTPRPFEGKLDRTPGHHVGHVHARRGAAYFSDMLFGTMHPSVRADAERLGVIHVTVCETRWDAGDSMFDDLVAIARSTRT